LPVLPRKDWPPDLVFLLLFRLLLAVAIGGSVLKVVAAALEKGGSSLPPLAEILLGGLAVQGSGLLLIHLFLRSARHTWSAAFGVSQGAFRAVAWGAGTALVVLPVAYVLQSGCAWLLDKVGFAPAPQPAVELLVKDRSLATRMAIGLFAVVFAPIVEESLFRGLLFPLLRDLGWPRLALVSTALLFGAIHLNLTAFLPLSLFGATLAWLYARTGNLLAPITAHAMFNLAPLIRLAMGVEFGQ
jgi:membrane protease YdiL (CAAX protease family)